MVEFKILIANSSSDQKLATGIREALERISEVKPYLATNYPIQGKTMSDRIMNAIEDCDFMICLLTSNSIKDQLVNQLIGYAYKIRRMKKSFRMITVSESKLDLYGLSNRTSEEIIFMDKLNKDLFLHNIIWHVRKNIPNGLNSNVFKLKIKCCSCKDLKENHNEFFGFIPAQTEIHETYSSGKKHLNYFCPFCGAANEINLLTFENRSLNVKEYVVTN